MNKPSTQPNIPIVSTQQPWNHQYNQWLAKNSPLEYAAKLAGLIGSDSQPAVHQPDIIGTGNF